MKAKDVAEARALLERRKEVLWQKDNVLHVDVSFKNRETIVRFQPDEDRKHYIQRMFDIEIGAIERRLAEIGVEL